MMPCSCSGGFKTEGALFTIKVVHDGVQALQYLKGEGKYADRAEYPIPALVLLDMRMPLADGFEVLRWMQSQSGFCKLPVIAIGGSMSEEMMTRALRFGASCVLSKTDDLIEFADELKKLIEAYLQPGSRVSSGNQKFISADWNHRETGVLSLAS